jgi:hypothetical protein
MNDSIPSPQEATNTSLLEQSKGRLREFFKNKYVMQLVPILVPCALTAVLLPIIGLVAAGAATTVAIKNLLPQLKIDMSTDTIEKLLKPIEGKQLGEDELQETITQGLTELLPIDKKVNEEAAKTLVILAPSLKEAALSNSRLDTPWLATSLETNLKEQGEMMEQVAPVMYALMLKEGQAFEADMQLLLKDWSQIAVEVTAINKSRVSDITSKAQAENGRIGHRVAAQDESTIDGVSIDSRIS